MTNMCFLNHWNERGNSFIEYFVLAMAVLLATVAFFQGGNFTSIRDNVESAFQGMVTQVVP